MAFQACRVKAEDVLIGQRDPCLPLKTMLTAPHLQWSLKPYEDPIMYSALMSCVYDGQYAATKFRHRRYGCSEGRITPA
jgi:hypothetical protein